LTELLILSPVLLSMALFGFWLMDVAALKLKLQEAARFTAFEMTSFSQTDYGPLGRSGVEMAAARRRAVAKAQARVLEEAQARYARSDSLGDKSPLGPFAAVAPFTVSLAELPTRWEAERIWAVPTAAVGDPRPYLAVLGRDIGSVASDWGFNLEGVTLAHVAGSLRGLPPLPRLATLHLEDSFALLTDDWHDPDGLDSNMVPGRAGRHGNGLFGGAGEDSLLYRQTRRLTFLGLGGTDPMELLVGWSLVSSLIRFPKLAFRGTFVVSHGYLDNAASGITRGCDGASHQVKHPAFSGMNNLHPRANGGDYGPGGEPLRLDGRGELKCFDTSPFRDTQSYEGTQREDGSLLVLMFAHRGNHFMGCRHAMSEDVTHAEDTLVGDVATDKVDCE
jgi:hypothetical protein